MSEEHPDRMLLGLNSCYCWKCGQYRVFDSTASFCLTCGAYKKDKRPLVLQPSGGSEK